MAVTNQAGEEYNILPDILAISDPEIELPTLNMNSDELSLSGIINTIITPQENQPMQHGSTVQVDPNTIQGQNQPITFHLQPVEGQINPVRDVRDNLQGFTQNNNWNNQNVQMQNLLEPMIATTADQKPSIRILEQPASHKLRFRYQCEGRGAGALQGQFSTADKKTFPKIQILGYKGAAVVVVSCVTHDNDPPKAHPHNLVSPASVGRDGCKKGVCTVNVNNDDMTVEFQHLGIQCVRKKDIADALKQRQEIRVDPYRQGFGHAESSGSIDLNAVKLCFQVFLENPSTPGKYTVVLPPVCSKPIFDAKAKKELQIMDISDNTAPVDGGKKIIILCERVARDDIKVKFYDSDPRSHWEEWGDFQASDVHKQYAISIKTPRYDDQNISEKKRIFIELVKPSDDSRSDPHEFFFLPLEGKGKGLKRDKDSVGTLDSGRLEVAPKNVYNGGGYTTTVKDEVKNETVDSTWKQMTSQAGHMSNRPRVDPYSKVVLNEGNLGLCGVGYNNQAQQNNLMNINGGYNIPPQQQEYNIPVSSADYQYIQHSPYSDSQSPYNISQPSPDSQGLANMNIASPLMDQNHLDTLDQMLASNGQNDPEVENLSGKINDLSFGAPLNIQPSGATSRTGGKRSSRDAENESGSAIVPRQMERQQSSITTPNVSTNLSDLLTNCRQINDL
eukprot:TRINITY_DN11868_c0_g1_i1.p1 TRINITY_DN11868_c0_g1~~TRINITY_DN11868_c0_g1_i1.p1  ORF type:complete len:674 (-),score=165.55 TRINITY_DN11868_c0_g1_i1:224-2245(-)